MTKARNTHTRSAVRCRVSSGSKGGRSKAAKRAAMMERVARMSAARMAKAARKRSGEQAPPPPAPAPAAAAPARSAPLLDEASAPRPQGKFVRLEDSTAAVLAYRAIRLLNVDVSEPAARRAVAEAAGLSYPTLKKILDHYQATGGEYYVTGGRGPRGPHKPRE